MKKKCEWSLQLMPILVISNFRIMSVFFLKINTIWIVYAPIVNTDSQWVWILKRKLYFVWFAIDLLLQNLIYCVWLQYSHFIYWTDFICIVHWQVSVHLLILNQCLKIFHWMQSYFETFCSKAVQLLNKQANLYFKWIQKKWF